MKIHIDTDTAQDKAKAQNTAQKKPATNGKTASAQAKKPSASQAQGTPTAGAQQPQAKPQPRVQMPDKLPNEPKPPKDVAAARKQQSTALKQRQQREVSGSTPAPIRDIDAGSGFSNNLYPLL